MGSTTSKAKDKANGRTPDPAKVRAATATVEKFHGELFTVEQGYLLDKGEVLFRVMPHFHETVTVNKIMAANAYADLLYGRRDDDDKVITGTASAWGTMLPRMADAVVRLGIERDSDEWRYLVQEAGLKPAGEVRKVANKRQAKALLTRQAKEWRKRQTAKKSANKATRKPGGSTDQTDKGKQTPEDVLKNLGAYIRKLPKEQRIKFAAEVRKVLSVIETEAATPGSVRSPRTGTSARTGTDG